MGALVAELAALPREIEPAQERKKREWRARPKGRVSRESSFAAKNRGTPIIP